MPLDDGSDDAILHGDSVTVTLAGRKYVCEEPTCKVNRRIRKKLAQSQKLGLNPQENPADLLEFVEIFLDAIREFPSIQADWEHVEENSTDDEIAAALQPLLEMLQRPMKAGRNGSSGRPASTTNQPSMKR